MNKKNVIEICVYILIIMLLIFGVGKISKDETSVTAIPTIEAPQTIERVQ